MWRMPPLSQLRPTQMSRASRIWMIVLRSYLVLVGGLILVRIIILAIKTERLRRSLRGGPPHVESNCCKSCHGCHRSSDGKGLLANCLNGGPHEAHQFSSHKSASHFSKDAPAISYRVVAARVKSVNVTKPAPMFRPGPFHRRPSPRRRRWMDRAVDLLLDAHRCSAARPVVSGVAD
jgi:hypothetical protein